MTEYELGEILYNTYDGLWQGSQMYFTLVGAYLVGANMREINLTLGGHTLWI